MIFDILLIIILIAIFGYTHTLLASNKIKYRIIEKTGDKIAYYRFFYNISAIIVLITIYYISPKPSNLLYDLVFPLDIVIFGLQILGLIGIFWAGSFIDLGEFLGVKQIKRYAQGKYNTDDLDEHKKLIYNGPFKISRHPIYFFSIIFLAARPSMDIFYFTILISFIIYFIVGSFYEEKKLVEQFGEEYKNYQNNVPMLIPYKFWNLWKTENLR